MTKIYVLEAHLDPGRLPGMGRSMVVSAFETEAAAVELLDCWVRGDSDAIGVIADMFYAANSTINSVETDDPDFEILVINARAKQAQTSLTDWYQRNR